MKVLSTNTWAKNMSDVEITNWVGAMVECGRTEAWGYWEEKKLVRCPFNQPLASI